MIVTKEMKEQYKIWSNSQFDNAYSILKSSGIKSNHDYMWHARRSITIGGSDIGAIAGLNKYFSALQVFNSKTCRSLPFEGNFATRLGAAEEDFIASELQYVLSNVKIVGSTTCTDLERPWRVAQIDNQGEILTTQKRFNIECKTAAFATADWGKPCEILNGEIVKDSDAVPQSYYAQCLYGLALANIAEEQKGLKNTIDYCLLLAHIGAEREIRVYKIKRNKSLEKILLNLADDFIFSHLMTDKPPMATSEEFSERFKNVKSTEQTVVIPNATAQAEKMLVLKAQIKELTAEYDKLESYFKAQLKDCSSAQDEQGNIIATWKSSSSSRFDTTRFKAEHPRLYKKYVKESISRRFLLKFKGLGE